MCLPLFVFRDELCDLAVPGFLSIIFISHSTFYLEGISYYSVIRREAKGWPAYYVLHNSCTRCKKIKSHHFLLFLSLKAKLDRHGVNKQFQVKKSNFFLGEKFSHIKKGLFLQPPKFWIHPQTYPNPLCFVCIGHTLICTPASAHPQFRVSPEAVGTRAPHI